MSSRQTCVHKGYENGNRQMVQENSLKPLIIVCGPTASGKSSLAIELAKALDTEIISADSIAIYKRLDIGTAKAGEEERKEVRHNLIDIVEPTEEFSVAEYEAAALKEIERIHGEGKIPIICGGTGYYIDAVLFKRSYGNCPKNPEIREKLENLYNERGAEYLYELLKEVDPESYTKLSKNDYLRVSRALEIYYSTGKKKSEIVDDSEPRFDYIAFSIGFEREVLYRRINERVDKMFEKGLVREVENLLEEGVPETAQSMQGIGYKEITSGIKTLKNEEEIKEIVKRNTRRYAKRQITWFKRLEGLDVLEPDNAFDKAMELINGRFIGK